MVTTYMIQCAFFNNTIINYYAIRFLMLLGNLVSSERAEKNKERVERQIEEETHESVKILI